MKTRIKGSSRSECGLFQSVISKYDQAIPTVREFCKKYHVKLLSVDITSESSKGKLKLEPLYIFSDNLGGYTIKGLEASL
jgi:hypothetical protein